MKASEEHESFAIYISRDGETYGPYSREQAYEYFKAGTFAAEDQAIREGAENWSTLYAVLFAKRKPPRRQFQLPAKVWKMFGLILLGLICITLGFRWRPDLSGFLTVAPTKASTSAPSTPIPLGTLEGEIFIVTKGGQNFKLGLVAIHLHLLPSVTGFFQRKAKDGAMAQGRLSGPLRQAEAQLLQANEIEDQAWKITLDSKYDDPKREEKERALEEAKQVGSSKRDVHRELSDKKNYFDTQDYYFDGLPHSLLMVRTNADGKFSIPLPIVGDFIITARAEREVGKESEKYYWVVPVSLNGNAKSAIMLSNHNLLTDESLKNLVPSLLKKETQE